MLSLGILVLALALALAGTAAAANASTSTSTCTEPRVRKSWSALSDDEKIAYLNAELCLMDAPVPAHLVNATALANATNLYDALQALHYAQVHYIHSNGCFLSWHRYFMTVHERLLRSECKYLGPLPYWDVQADVRGGLANSSVWHAVYGFGSYNKTDDKHCIQDGPFAYSTMSLDTNFARVDPMCITTDPQPDLFAYGRQEIVDKCDAIDDYAAFSDCYAQLNGPHGSGHGGVGAIMLDPARSPAHPLFWLAHANLDRLWWHYQKKDLPARLTKIGGPVISNGLDSFLFMQPKAIPPEAMLPYIGDPGEVTTLDHVLWMVDIFPNVTIGQVMDLRGQVICADYE